MIPFLSLALLNLTNAASTPIIVVLEGAALVPCAAEVAREVQTDTCYLASAADHLALKVTAADRARITYAHYTASALNHASKQTVSEELFDPAGKATWSTDITTTLGASGKAPPNALQPATYRVTVRLTADGVDTERVFALQVFAPEEKPADGIWRIANTDLGLRAPGCWKRAADPVVALSLKACEDQAAIKLVAAKPASGVNLEQYVTNSVEVYSRAKMWRVLERHTETTDGDAHVYVRVEQTINGKIQTLAKLFSLHNQRFIVLTYYPDEGQPPPGWAELSHWLIPEKPASGPD